jgi:hypothetical protein
MKLYIKEVLTIVAMASLSFGFMKSLPNLSPSDLDLMVGTSGALVYQAPLQKNLGDMPYTFKVKGAIMVPEALFDISGVVLGKKRYLPFGDHRVASWDIGMGWGPMSDPKMLDHVSFWQAGRSMHFRHGEKSPITKNRIVPNFANMHVIPESDAVRQQIKQVRKGDIVRMTGFLVTVIDGMNVQKTSTSRIDTGKSSSEILYVKSVDLDPV